MCLILVMGKAEGVAENWHGHVTAVTVAPEYRRIALATRLMSLLENTSEQLASNIVYIVAAVACGSALWLKN